MILVRRLGAGVVSDEHFATLNGAANGLFFAVSENLENMFSFLEKNDTNQFIKSLFYEAQTSFDFPRLKGSQKALWEIRNTR